MKVGEKTTNAYGTFVAVPQHRDWDRSCDDCLGNEFRCLCDLPCAEIIFVRAEEPMTDFEIAIQQLCEKLPDIKYQGDLSDLGNEIGIIVGNFTMKDKEGQAIEDFISGIRHGISLTDGTHE